MRIKDQIFEDDAVYLDGSEFDGCLFKRCKIIFRGDAETALRDNEFESCEFVFDGAARRTMGFIKGMMDSSDGFLVTMLKAFELDPSRLARLSAAANSEASEAADSFKNGDRRPNC
jgi:hypothetical protein